MQYLGFIFGIFGLLAYLQIGPLKRRIQVLEEESSRTEGTPAFEKRAALTEAARAYIGKRVRLDLKEDQGDTDILMYGNTKHGGNTILDVDGEWMLVRIDTPRGTKEKLIRLASVDRISVDREP